MSHAPAVPLSPFDPAAVAPETRAFAERLEAWLAAAPSPLEIPVETMRAMRASGQGVFPIYGPLDSARWEETDGAAGPVAMRVSDPEGEALGAYLQIHGGGWTFGAPEQADGLNAQIAAAARCRVVAPRYRLAPENRWPAPLEDCLAAVRWALASQPGPLVIGGESAGAHLAASVLLALREEGALGRVRGAALTYGMFDLAGTPSVALWGTRFLVLSEPVIRWFVGNLLGEGDPGDPAVSPLKADLRGLPPALFQCGTLDPLIDDTLFMAARWQAAGGVASLDLAAGAVHGYDAFDLAVARAALARRAAFIAERLAA